MKYIYPAIFRTSSELENFWEVNFPNIDFDATCGYSLYEALEDAEDTLGYVMTCKEDREAGRLKGSFTNRVDEPTPINEVKVELDEYSTEAFVTLIKCDTDEYRKKLEAENAARG